MVRLRAAHAGKSASCCVDWQGGCVNPDLLLGFAPPACVRVAHLWIAFSLKVRVSGKRTLIQSYCRFPNMFDESSRVISYLHFRGVQVILKHLLSHSPTSS